MREVCAYGVLMLRRFVSAVVLAVALTFIAHGEATAALVRLDRGDFAPGPAQVTFDAVAEGTEGNGLEVDGFTFSYADGDGVLFISSLGFPVPIPSDNVQDPVLTGFVGTPADLTVTFAPVLTFGLGYAFLALEPDPSALSISAFAGSELLGTLEFGADFDPLFPGGFAGVGSSTPFDRVVISFTHDASAGFAIDNLRTVARQSQVPEPSSLALLGLAAVAAFRRRRLM